jgi:hypothetical protein
MYECNMYYYSLSSFQYEKLAVLDVLRKLTVEMRIAIRKAELTDQPADKLEKALSSYRAVLAECPSIIKWSLKYSNQAGLDFKGNG